jgi:hypothetical protein
MEGGSKRALEIVEEEEGSGEVEESKEKRTHAESTADKGVEAKAVAEEREKQKEMMLKELRKRMEEKRARKKEEERKQAEEEEEEDEEEDEEDEDEDEDEHEHVGQKDEKVAERPGQSLVGITTLHMVNGVVEYTALQHTMMERVPKELPEVTTYIDNGSKTLAKEVGCSTPATRALLRRLTEYDVHCSLNETGARRSLKGVLWQNRVDELIEQERAETDAAKRDVYPDLAARSQALKAIVRKYESSRDVSESWAASRVNAMSPKTVEKEVNENNVVEEMDEAISTVLLCKGSQLATAEQLAVATVATTVNVVVIYDQS